MGKIALRIKTLFQTPERMPGKTFALELLAELLSRPKPRENVMKKTIILFLIIAATGSFCFGQASGNIGYSQAYGKTRAEQNERSKRVLLPAEMPPGSNTIFLEASVLMNVLAEEYVAVFGLSQESPTVAECNQKMDALIQSFSENLKPLGIGSNDFFVDFAVQNQVYGYRVEGTVAKEELAGFELKKNVSIHYRDKQLLDKLVLAASRSKIYDLIKVDYVIKDPQPIQNRLMEEATAIIKQKTARYEKLLGIKTLPQPQIYAEKPSIYYPTDLYQSYTAYEAERVDRDLYRSKYMVQDLRKNRTFFFNALNADGFDLVINPVIVEPVIQFTIYLKVKYDLEPRKKSK